MAWLAGVFDSKREQTSFAHGLPPSSATSSVCVTFSSPETCHWSGLPPCPCEKSPLATRFSASPPRALDIDANEHRSMAAPVRMFPGNAPPDLTRHPFVNRLLDMHHRIHIPP